MTYSECDILSFQKETMITLGIVRAEKVKLIAQGEAEM
jgi:hypothetical protein